MTGLVEFIESFDFNALARDTQLPSERWRRAHGIGPRRPASKPWLAEGCSRSTWYRRKAKAREAARNLDLANRQGVADLYIQGCNLASIKRSDVSDLLTASCDRAEAFVRELQSELAELARCQAVMTAIIAELRP